MVRDWKAWRGEEDECLRACYKATVAQVTANKFWGEVYEGFIENYPHRTRTAVQQRALLLGLLSKRVPSGKYICIECGRLGVFNRKRGLCLRCYQVLKGENFRGCAEGPGEVDSSS